MLFQSCIMAYKYLAKCYFQYMEDQWINFILNTHEVLIENVPSAKNMF